jgi:hypothetical protein
MGSSSWGIGFPHVLHQDGRYPVQRTNGAMSLDALRSSPITSKGLTTQFIAHLEGNVREDRPNSALVLQ